MKHPIKGFSLFELIVTLVIISLMATLGIPSFQGAMRSSRLTSYINEISTALGTARSEAIKQNRSVYVCKKSLTGTPPCSTSTSGADWDKTGWLVFVDANSDGVLNTTCTPLPCDPDTILIDHEPLPTGFALRSSSAIASSIRYTTTGVIGNGLSANAYFYLCNPDTGTFQPASGTSRVLVLNTIGRTRMAGDVNNDGIPELVPATAVNISTCTP